MMCSGEQGTRSVRYFPNTKTKSKTLQRRGQEEAEEDEENQRLTTESQRRQAATKNEKLYGAQPPSAAREESSQAQQILSSSSRAVHAERRFTQRKIGIKMEVPLRFRYGPTNCFAL